MAANMAAKFMENEYIHKISCYNMLSVCFLDSKIVSMIRKYYNHKPQANPVAPRGKRFIEEKMCK